ncbi:hypothetical protein [Brucella cytisi]|uniref:Mobilization protein n=1 Tax=Brucella cytisi TaxID=407152 RepID=A0A1J6HB27_9HYPH|nr:hypothetical protein [Brucella cytisi]OIS90316.1 hypothetical protein BLA27_27385 [Brucella cytisi]
MALGDPIKIRLSPERQLIYEDEAARLNKPLGTYLRERLEADDDKRGQLDAFRHEIGAALSSIRHAVEARDSKRGAGETPAAAPSQINNALLLEMVLLLREIGGPERMKRTQAELKRQGLQMWTPSKE